jgi:hypothetical protein
MQLYCGSRYLGRAIVMIAVFEILAIRRPVIKIYNNS